MSVANIARRHLRDALTGKLKSCEVSEWLDDQGKPVKVYWKPLTGAQQRQIDEASGEVGKVCMMLKVRALNEDGTPMFANESLASLEHDFDYSVIQNIVFLMISDLGQGDLAKE